MTERLEIETYDTTLRDGAQTPGVKLTVGEKLRIAEKLDDFGFAFIEGGWPETNPTDSVFFKELRGHRFKNAKLAAFGMTGRVGVKAENDPGLDLLLKSETGVITIFGKSWMLHVREVLRANAESNLQAIFESVVYLKGEGRRVFYDAEHFYDGFRDNPEYALNTLVAAKRAGAEIIILCDTNGGSIPEFVFNATCAAKQELGENFPLGIHVHDDGGLAVVSTIAAVRAGATQVQGTVNGAGERAGNVDWCVFLPTARFKYGVGFDSIDLSQITDLSRFVELQNGLLVPPNRPYVGENAFKHKGGVHVDAMRKHPEAYQHVKPEVVGQRTTFEHSDQGGGANILEIAEKFGYKVDKSDPKVREGVRVMKELKVLGDSQEFLLAHRQFDLGDEPFDVLDSTQITIWRNRPPVALVDVCVNGDNHHEVATGEGGLNAFDVALKRALSQKFAEVSQVELTDYRVQLPVRQMGTEAEVEVYIEFGVNGHRWTSIRRNVDEQIANQDALVDGYKYYLLRLSFKA